MKPIFPTVDNSTLKGESHLNSILMLSDCVGERLTLEVALGMGLANRL